MSNHCRERRYDPGARTGADACPFTTLYWDFLDRNRERLGDNRRLALPMRNLERLGEPELAEIRSRARRLMADFDREAGAG